ncbi:response regulator [Pseudomonadota bacterium]
MPNILIVDDDEDIRQWFSEVLTELGYSVTTAEGPQDLARTLALGHVDLVLIDYHMPTKNGLLAIREVKRAGITTPMVVITSDANQQVAVECFRAGAVDFIAKPMDQDYLAIVVERVLAAHAVNLKNMAYRALGYTKHKDSCHFYDDGHSCTCGLAEVFENIQEF